MHRNFGLRQRHAGLPRAFDLSSIGYFLDFALVPVAIAAMIAVACGRGAGGLSLATALGIGILAWSLAEYWIHRMVFHGRTPFEPMHQMHHELPRDMIGVASWGTFLGFGAILLVASQLADLAPALAFTAGIMAGYLFYCAIHVRFHHHGEGARLSRYVAFMNAHHAGHHRGGKGNFGVSSPLWDFAFGTFRRSA